MSSMREFTPLQIRKRVLGAGAASKYRIYRTKSDFITLEARTATEACKVSGVKRPYKIVRISPASMKMLDSGMFEGAREEVVETPRIEMEGEPIIIPAPMERGARIIDDYDGLPSGGGFVQVPLASMGKRSAEDTEALKKVVEEITSEAKEATVLEKPVIITPDMITVDVTPGTNEAVYKIAKEPAAPVEAPVAAPPTLAADTPLAVEREKTNYALVGSGPEVPTPALDKDDYTREEMLLKQMMEQRIENPPHVEKPEILRKQTDIMPAEPAPARKVTDIMPAEAAPARKQIDIMPAIPENSAKPADGSGELTQEEIAKLLGE